MEGKSFNHHQLKRLESENARLDSIIKKLDIQLREFDLANKPGFWKSVFTNPAFLAGIITIFVTAGTATVSFIIAGQQQKVDLEKSRLQAIVERDKHEDGLISGIVTSQGGCSVAARLTHYLYAGVFTNERKRKAMENMRNIINDQDRCGFAPL
jgi:hypothetical protein